jgi:hypothetical protein
MLLFCEKESKLSVKVSYEQQSGEERRLNDDDVQE